jgi:hypothetical protein
MRRDMQAFVGTTTVVHEPNIALHSQDNANGPVSIAEQL